MTGYANKRGNYEALMQAIDQKFGRSKQRECQCEDWRKILEVLMINNGEEENYREELWGIFLFNSLSVRPGWPTTAVLTDSCL